MLRFDKTTHLPLLFKFTLSVKLSLGEFVVKRVKTFSY